ncbi:surface-adhesin E family protein [uncultured Azohydromonas sp.]|uniref:surface-adhesin E family protein n=1 Tax=uncultured Azohydromonas sp. TaxID=487342 RepID=UPI002622DE1B|nr:surface-adhesin E family protein [uncultured Azohydromonas sp.]
MAQPVTDFDRSMQLLYEVDCTGRRHRLAQYQSFKGRMGGGDPTRGGMVFGDWMTAGPGTVGGHITKVVCNRSRSTAASHRHRSSNSGRKTVAPVR